MKKKVLPENIKEKNVYRRYYQLIKRPIHRMGGNISQ
jgi:hypothetical protein